MRSGRRPRRVHHHPIAGPGSVVTLAPEEAHHVTQVLRLAPGDALSVFDGVGGEWDAALLSVGRDGVQVRLGTARQDRVEPPLRVVLFQGLCRPDRMEWAIQKATEVGAAAIHPILLRYGEERPPSPDRLERWRRIAREAAKQSGRRVVPEVLDPAPAPHAIPEGVLALLLAPSAGDSARLALTGAAPGAVWLLVGPEGGLEPEESAALVEGGWSPVRLGPRTLRTETAGVVGCALVLHAWGDL